MPVTAPWATPADVAAAYGDAAPARTDEQWTTLLDEATAALYLLSGRQYRGTATSRVVFVQAADHPEGRLPGWWPCPADPLVGSLHGAGAWWGRERTAVVNLPAPPVTHVDEVRLLTAPGDPADTGQVLDPTGYRCTSGGELERTDWAPWPLDGTLLVTYRHGTPPPAGGKAAAVALAAEMARDDIGDGTGTGLPARVRSLTREGVNAVLKDDTATEDLDHWRTGIGRVDLWLSTVNPHRQQRPARCWTPGQPHAHPVH